MYPVEVCFLLTQCSWADLGQLSCQHPCRAQAGESSIISDMRLLHPNQLKGEKNLGQHVREVFITRPRRCAWHFHSCSLARLSHVTTSDCKAGWEMYSASVLKRGERELFFSSPWLCVCVCVCVHGCMYTQGWAKAGLHSCMWKTIQ